MASKNLLTDRKIRTARAAGSVYYLNDGAGLRLRIRPDGAQSWVYRYRVHGREGMIGFGNFPAVSLETARKSAGEANKQVAAGLNPATEKRLKKAGQALASTSTFKAIGDEWLEHNKPHWSATHYERNEGLLRRLLYPTLGKLPISSISEAALLRVLTKHYNAGIEESARRARGCASQIFAYAKATHRVTANPAKEIAENVVLKRPNVKHFAALPQEDVGKLINELRKTGLEQRLDAFTVAGLFMALYTGLRDNSIRAAQWKEINFDQALWTVPANRMKLQIEHQVPLPTQALVILKEIERLSKKSPESFVFQSRSKRGYMAENTLRLVSVRESPSSVCL